MDKCTIYAIFPVMQEKTARNREIYTLNVKGLGARRIAKLYNITPQRVTQIIKALKAAPKE